MFREGESVRRAGTAAHTVWFFSQLSAFNFQLHDPGLAVFMQLNSFSGKTCRRKSPTGIFDGVH
jgi:hypothetical protein